MSSFDLDQRCKTIRDALKAAAQPMTIKPEHEPLPIGQKPLPQPKR